MIAVTLFETIVGVSTIAFCSFLIWWVFDAYQSSIAMEAAREQLEHVGLATSAKIFPDEVSIKLRESLSQDNSEGHEDFFVLLASLYILRHEMGLRCKWFAEELSNLPEPILEQLRAPGRSHIRTEDVKRLLLPKVPTILGREITSKIASRLEDNIQDLKTDTAPLLRRVAEPM